MGNRGVSKDARPPEKVTQVEGTKGNLFQKNKGEKQSLPLVTTKNPHNQQKSVGNGRVALKTGAASRKRKGAGRGTITSGVWVVGSCISQNPSFQPLNWGGAFVIGGAAWTDTLASYGNEHVGYKSSWVADGRTNFAWGRGDQARKKGSGNANDPLGKQSVMLRKRTVWRKDPRLPNFRFPAERQGEKKMGRTALTGHAFSRLDNALKNLRLCRSRKVAGGVGGLYWGETLWGLQ